MCECEKIESTGSTPRPQRSFNKIQSADVPTSITIGGELDGQRELLGVVLANLNKLEDKCEPILGLYNLGETAKEAERDYPSNVFDRIVEHNKILNKINQRVLRITEQVQL